MSESQVIAELKSTGYCGTCGLTLKNKKNVVQTRDDQKTPEGNNNVHDRDDNRSSVELQEEINSLKRKLDCDKENEENKREN